MPNKTALTTWVAYVSKPCMVPSALVGAPYSRRTASPTRQWQATLPEKDIGFTSQQGVVSLPATGLELGDRRGDSLDRPMAKRL
jgi:hypothetical protein